MKEIEITKLQKLYVKIASMFILNKDKRKSFRTIKTKQFIAKNNYFVVYGVFKNIIYPEIEKKQSYINIFYDTPKTIEEYNKDKEEFLKNLDEKAKNNCLKILNRIDKALMGYTKSEDFFTQEELMQINLSNIYLKNNVKKVNNYYQLEHYKLPINNFEPSVFYYKHGIDTLKTFDKLDDKAIIDVGCFIADSCLVFRDYTKNKIYTFEPDINNYKLAQKTIELNNLQDVVLENLALGDKEEENNISINGNGSSILSKDKTLKKQKIKTTTLDKYVKEHNIKVGLIKVDIEGFEPYFLKGAVETIKEQKPIILLSIYHNYHDFFKLKSFIEDLNCGYKFDFFKGLDGSLYVETLLICEVY